MRERTYWPELCVVQLAGDHEVAVIDAQAPASISPRSASCSANQAVMKVFHAARQDIEIFVLRFGDVPRPLFDTQIAAMVAGFGDQVGYEALVSALTGGTIDKAHRFSDWSARPLSAAQIAYAAADVTYLRDGLHAACAPGWSRTAGWTGWPRKWRCWPIPRFTAPIPRRCGSGCVRAAATAAFSAWLRALAAWREREAQRVNIPRQRLLRDETLLEIAATAPDDAGALARARGITRGFAEGRTGASLLAAIADGEGAAGRRAAGGARCARRRAPVAGAGVAAEGAAGRQMRGPPRRGPAGRQLGRHRPAGDRKMPPTSPRCTAGAARCSARTRWR